MLHMVNAGAVNIGDITIPTTPYTTDTQTSDYAAFTSADSPIVIPAGKYNVRIHNEGLVNITVNGTPLPISNVVTFQSYSNPATQELDYTPEITIVIPANGQGSFNWNGPS